MTFKMEWQIILALVIAAPLILLPVAFVWYLNIGGFLAVRKERAEQTAAGKVKMGASSGQNNV